MEESFGEHMERVFPFMRDVKTMRIKDDNLPSYSGQCEIKKKGDLFYITIEDMDGDLPNEMVLCAADFADLCRCINGLIEEV